MNRLVKYAFATSFSFLAITFIFWDIGYHTSIEYDFPVFFESKTPSRLRIEPFKEKPALRAIPERCLRLSGKRMQSFLFTGAIVSGANAPGNRVIKNINNHKNRGFGPKPDIFH